MFGMATDPREAAWFEVHDALPAYWHVGPVTFDPARVGGHERCREIATKSAKAIEVSRA